MIQNSIVYITNKLRNISRIYACFANQSARLSVMCDDELTFMSTACVGWVFQYM